MAAGAIPIGAALFADDAKFHAPRWLVGMIGSMFVLAGVLLLMSAGAAARRPETDVVGALLGALVATGFLVLSGWALFLSGGPRAWNMSGSLPLWLLPAWVSTGLFYALMGVGALLCVVLTVFAWRQLFRALAAAGSDPRARGPHGVE